MITDFSVKDINNYTIYTEEGVEHGIFFRSPIQKVSYDAYYGNDKKTSAYIYQKAINNSRIRRIYEILIGNGNIVKNLGEWLDNLDFGGFNANKLCSPIYFSRKYRSLRVVFSNPDTLFTLIKSHGYESQYNICNGACHIERTVFKFRNGSKNKLTVKEHYRFTYNHIITKLLSDNNDVEVSIYSNV